MPFLRVFNFIPYWMWLDSWLVRELAINFVPGTKLMATAKDKFHTINPSVL
jgi:hypothetical protein